MSVKVNLLPSDISEREAAGRARGAVGLGLAVLAGGLGFLYFQGTQNVSAAQARVATEQQSLDALQTELDRLGEFDELSQRADASDEIIAVAMAGEVSFAGILQDIAAVMPSSADLDTLGIALLAPGGEPQLGETRDAIGTLNLSGRSIEGHAPGLERFLLEFDKIAGFSDLYFANSTREEFEGVTLDIINFDVEVDLGLETLTRRYVDGLPEVLR